MWTVKFQMFKLVLEKAEEPEIKLPTSVGSSKKLESSRKAFTFCFIDYPKAFDCVDNTKQWKILQEMGIQEHLTCLLRNLYAGQEATVRTGHGTTDWFQIGKGVRQRCILSPCLFNFFYICVRKALFRFWALWCAWCHFNLSNGKAKKCFIRIIPCLLQFCILGKEQNSS